MFSTTAQHILEMLVAESNTCLVPHSSVSQVWLGWVPCSGPRRAAVKVLAGLQSAKDLPLLEHYFL